MYKKFNSKKCLGHFYLIGSIYELYKINIIVLILSRFYVDCIFVANITYDFHKPLNHGIFINYSKLPRITSNYLK